jgi:polyhydroxybutyrate depolymerase
MSRKVDLLLRALLAVAAAIAFAPGAASAGPESRSWRIDGVGREAIVHLPEGAPRPGPLVLAFHGHGGRARNVQRTMAIHERWPDAVVVYPQGLPTPSARDPKGERTGWQNRPGEQGDRDLRLVDAIVADLRAAGWVDDARIFATGHSNGGGMTYSLWLARHDMLAGVAPVAAGSYSPRALLPLPCMHVAGRNDPIVRFAGQERTMRIVREVNGCSDHPTAWATDCRLYPSRLGTPFVAMVLDGGHEYPPQAPPLIVRFLREQRAPIAFGPPAPGRPWPRTGTARAE